MVRIPEIDEVANFQVFDAPVAAPVLTREMMYHDFSYYLSERDRARMTSKAWYQYERSRELHGAKYAHDEYVSCHAKNVWEDLFPEYHS